MEIKVASEIGYCSGVSRAIEKAITYAAKHPGEKTYSLGAVAHNQTVVQQLLDHGVVPIDPMDMIPGSHVAITAHGSPLWVYDKIAGLRCEMLDCTCPIVFKAQRAVNKLSLEGYDLFIFGDPEHQEVKGLVGHAIKKGVSRYASDSSTVRFVGRWNELFDESKVGPRRSSRIGIVSQTTNVPSKYRDFIGTVIQRHFDEANDILAVNTICPIVTIRLEEAEKLSKEVDVTFVVGSKKSANTVNLASVCQRAITVETPDDVLVVISKFLKTGSGAIYIQSLEDRTVDRYINKVGVTAGTSTPIEVVDAVVKRLEAL